MITSLDSAILFVGIIINIPILYALYHMWVRRKLNGINKIIRNLTLWWILSFAILHNLNLISRLLVNNGFDTDVAGWDSLFFLAYMFIGIMTIYGSFVIRYFTVKHDKEEDGGHSGKV